MVSSEEVEQALARLAEETVNHSSLDDFFKHLDLDNDQSIDADELQKGLEQLGATLSKESVEKLMESVGATGDGRLSFAQFEKVVRQVPSAARETEDWVSSLGLQKRLANHLDRAVDACHAADHGLLGLARIGSMTPDQVQSACTKFCEELQQLLLAGIERLQDPAEDRPETGLSHGKFQFTNTGKVGDFASTIEFFGGLDGQIGLPNPNVLEAMQSEHCLQDDSDDTFVTYNYGQHSTTPAVEWEYVVAPRADVEYGGQLRVRKDIEELLSDENAIKAGLIREEIIALRLYTGPMYVKYNAKLRNYPQKILDGMKGNGYVTTIHCIVSGVIKLSKVWTLPKSKRVYRGLGGLMLPEKFWKPDEYGCKGGVERGLMSTTTVKEVAMQYSGKDSGRPTIFEINVGQIDRGANLNWLSQYPKEEEVLMPPLSNLEVIGAPRIETSSFGPVMVIPLRVNVNIKSSTIEEVLKRRKVLHLSMLQNLVHSARHELLDSSPAHFQREAQAALEWSGVVGELEDLVVEAQNQPGEWYNDDDNLSNAMSTAMAAKKGAKRKFGALRERLEKVLPPVQPESGNSGASGPEAAKAGAVSSGLGADGVMQRPADMSRGISLAFDTAASAGEGARVLMDPHRRASLGDALRGLDAVSRSPGSKGRQLVKVQRTRVADWAREGFQFMVEAGTEVLPWDAIAEGKLSTIELPAQLNQRQAELAWRCIKHGIDACADHRQRMVVIRAVKGGVLKVDAAVALQGTEVSLWQERKDSGGKTMPVPQTPAGDAVCVLLPAIKANPHLRRLDLGAPELSSTQAVRVAQVLKGIAALETLRVSGDAIDVVKARTAAELNYAIWIDAADVDGHCSKTKLDPSRSSSGGSVLNYVQAVGRSFSGIDRKASLASDQDGIVSRGVTDARKAQRTKRSSVIEVFGEEVAADDVYTLAEGICLAGFLESNRLNLAVLNLAGHKIGGGGATALAQALKGNDTLVELNLRGNMIGAMGASAIATLISSLSTLESLELRGNNMGVRGPKVLAPVVAPSPVLTTLNGLRLDYATVKEVSKQAPTFFGSAAVLMATSGSIKLLRVRGVSEPGYEGPYIARRLRECGEGLEVLDLSNNGLGQTGAKALASVLQEVTNLKALFLEGNSLRSDGLIRLLSGIEASKHLTHLDLRRNGIDAAGFDALADVMKQGLGRRWSFSASQGLKEVRLEGNIGWKDRHAGLRLEYWARPATRVTFLTWEQYFTVLGVTLASASIPLLLVGIFYFGNELWDDGHEVAAFYLVLACSFALYTIFIGHSKYQVHSAALDFLSRVLKTQDNRIAPIPSDGATQPSGTKAKRKRPNVSIDVDHVARTGSTDSDGGDVREMRRERRLILAMENKLFLAEDDDAVPDSQVASAAQLNSVEELMADEEEEEDEGVVDDVDLVQEWHGDEEPEEDGVRAEGSAQGQKAANGGGGRNLRSPHVGFASDAEGGAGQRGSEPGGFFGAEEEEAVDMTRRDSTLAASVSEVVDRASIRQSSRLAVEGEETVAAAKEGRRGSAGSGRITSPAGADRDLTGRIESEGTEDSSPSAKGRRFSTPKHVRGRAVSLGVHSDGVLSQSRFASGEHPRVGGQEVAVDERVLRRVGMLTQQFKEATCTPEALDKRVKDVYKKMQLHSAGIASSGNQLAEILMLPAMAVTFFVLAIFYALMSWLLIEPWATGTIDKFSHFRLQASFGNQSSALSYVANYTISDGNCAFEQVNQTILDDFWYLELLTSVNIQTVTVNFNESANDEPVDVTLWGCSEQGDSLVGPQASKMTSTTTTTPSAAAPTADEQTPAPDQQTPVPARRAQTQEPTSESVRWSCPQAWKELAQKKVDATVVQSVALGFQELFRKTIVRFIPLVLCAACLLVVYFNLTMRLGHGRRALLLGTLVYAGLHGVAAISATDNANEALARLVPALLILPVAGLMLRIQHSFINVFPPYAVLYIPLVYFYLVHLLVNDKELPSILFPDGTRYANYDQYNLAPLVGALALVSLVLRARRIWQLYWTMNQALPDLHALEDEWNALVASTSSAEVTDVSTEVDRMRAQIIHPPRQLQPTAWQVKETEHGAEEEEIASAMVRRTHLQELWGALAPRRERSLAVVTSLQQLFVQAAGLESIMREKLIAWGCASEGKFVRRPLDAEAAQGEGGEVYLRALDAARAGDAAVQWSGLKGKVRAVEKCYLSYGGDVSRLLDLCRETIVFDRLEQIANCIAVIRQDRTVEVVRVTNRLNPEGRASMARVVMGSSTWEKNDGPMLSGYRDVAINLMIQTTETRALGLDRHVFELRLAPRSIHQLTLGTEGDMRHSRYQNLRNALSE